MSGLMAGKRLLITGVITEQSIAFQVARLAQEQGATVVLTGFGRVSLVERFAKRLPGRRRSSSWTSPTGAPRPRWPTGSREHVDGIDGVLHSIAFAPAVGAGRRLPEAPLGGRRDGAARLRLLATRRWRWRASR